MLGDYRKPYIQSIMRLIETQSKPTIAKWCLDYTEKHILPIYKKSYPADPRPENAIKAARNWLAGKVKLPQVKDIILNQAHAAAREAEQNPAAQAAARTCGQAAAVIHAPTHSLGLVFYGTAAIAYDQVGTDQPPEVYEQIVQKECAKMLAALKKIAIKNEPNPAKVNWHC